MVVNLEKKDGRIVIHKSISVYKHLDTNQYIVRSRNNKKKIMTYRNKNGMYVTDTGRYFIHRSRDLPKDTDGKYIIKSKNPKQKIRISKHIINT